MRKTRRHNLKKTGVRFAYFDVCEPEAPVAFFGSVLDRNSVEDAVLIKDVIRNFNRATIKHKFQHVIGLFPWHGMEGGAV